VIKLQKICDYLEQFAPTELAESWDNTGLLVGDPRADIRRLMTCLTVTPESVDEAVARNVDLIVTHHPMMFRPVNRITAESVAGTMLLDLIKNNIAIYSPHTAFDSTSGGINEQIATALHVGNARPLKPLAPDQTDRGAGRIGVLQAPIAGTDFATQIKQRFNIDCLAIVGDPAQQIKSVAIGCGSGGSFLNDAIRLGADALVTGETTFHTCLEAKAENVSLFLLGHFASERFAVEVLADQHEREFANVKTWASDQESDPIRFI